MIGTNGSSDCDHVIKHWPTIGPCSRPADYGQSEYVADNLGAFVTKLIGISQESMLQKSAGICYQIDRDILSEYVADNLQAFVTKLIGISRASMLQTICGHLLPN